MKKLIITDLDDTLNNFNEVFPGFISDHYGIKKKDGTSYTEKDIKSYEISNHIPLPDYMNGKLYPALIDFIETGNVALSDPKPYAAETIKGLSRDYDIIICTARSYGSGELRERLRFITYDWLSKVGLDQYLNMVIFNERSAEKVDFCRLNKERIFAFIDDKPDTVTSISELGINSILINRPHNAYFKEGCSVKRANNWKKVHELIKSFEKDKEDKKII